MKHTSENSVDLDNERLIITGSGRSGTSFLVKLLTELDYPTGFKKEGDDYTRTRGDKDDGYEFSDSIRAGMEYPVDIEGTVGELKEQAQIFPQILKSPHYSVVLKFLLQHEIMNVGHILMPVRDLEEVAASRQQEGLQWIFPDSVEGLTLRAHGNAIAVGRTVEACMLFDVPLSLMHFPHLITNKDYCFEGLQNILGDIHEERFSDTFDALADPSRIQIRIGESKSLSEDDYVQDELFEESFEEFIQPLQDNDVFDNFEELNDGDFDLSASEDELVGDTPESQEQKKTSQKQVVILGNGRSGTSVYTAVVDKLGAHFAGEGYRDYGFDLPHYESYPAHIINQKIFARAMGLPFDLDGDLQWHLPHPNVGAIKESLGEFDEEIQEFIDLYKEKDIWVFKNPKTTLTVEHWDRKLTNPYYIVVERNSFNVARSWNRLEEIGETDVQDVVYQHHMMMSYITRFVKDKNSVIVSYENLLHERRQVIDKLIDFMDIEPNEAQIKDAMNVVSDKKMV